MGEIKNLWARHNNSLRAMELWEDHSASAKHSGLSGVFHYSDTEGVSRKILYMKRGFTNLTSFILLSSIVACFVVDVFQIDRLET